MAYGHNKRDVAAMRNVLTWALITALLTMASFFAGSFFANHGMPQSQQLGDESMASFMSDFSALAYLNKGDTRSAMLILRDSADRHLLLAREHGTPQLQASDAAATNRWFVEYAKLRGQLPSNPQVPGTKGFEEKVNAVLKQAQR